MTTTNAHSPKAEAERAVNRRGIWLKLTLVAGCAVLAVTGGAAIGYAASTSSAKVIEACYNNKGGAMYLHATAETAKAYSCKTGYKPVAWNNAPAAPDVFYGKLITKAAATPGSAGGYRIERAATLLAETPLLPAGGYDVRATAQLDLYGQTGPLCFVAVVGVLPKGDGMYGADFSQNNEDVRSVIVDDQLSVTANNRLGLYCEEKTIGDPVLGDEGYADSANLSATLSYSMKGVLIHRK
jgi:hypothetical protein